MRPKTEIESKDLFESESGFKEALAGVYSNMTSQQLYGRDLTFGIIDALGQCWDIKSTANEFFISLSITIRRRSFRYVLIPFGPVCIM